MIGILFSPGKEVVSGRTPIKWHTYLTFRIPLERKRELHVKPRPLDVDFLLVMLLMGFTPSIFDNLAHFLLTMPMMRCDTG